MVGVVAQAGLVLKGGFVLEALLLQADGQVVAVLGVARRQGHGAVQQRQRAPGLPQLAGHMAQQVVRFGVQRVVLQGLLAGVFGGIPVLRLNVPQGLAQPVVWAALDGLRGRLFGGVMFHARSALRTRSRKRVWVMTLLWCRAASSIAPGDVPGPQAF